MSDSSASRLPASAAPEGPLGVVITGGSRGLGLAMAQRFLAAGDAVVLCARDAERLEVARAELVTATGAGERLHTVACDVADPEAAERLADFAVERLGSIHRWLNNAGTAGRHKRPLVELSAADIAETCTTNLTGSMQLCAAALRRMQAQPAAPEPRYHLFNFGFSGLGAHFSRTSIPHRVSKLGVAELSRQLRRELQASGEQGIGVHELRPGLVRTELLLADLPEQARPIIDRLAEPPEQVADALVPRVRGITGTGRTLQYRSPLATLVRALSAVPTLRRVR
ncbi:SDR family oxidoreductase [Halorhodospira halophila]|uniref:Short-chain dehydrogenase/reductase SDR n=1 Tax=Halorhodospira halophila (strain DSM 244 / SL1) TaxID=349124 RepID=A1WUH4_HALHL|nr:SDR family oxidoreductase [Halorhodospira halophila]ABM61336.1 short-chain dehydrogenase/reductase SDR [Halorhodospira halophila SL1]MBK1729081.1 NAD(P)-dependent oxidoreductase [Halorhodospira halophila]